MTLLRKAGVAMVSSIVLVGVTASGQNAWAMAKKPAPAPSNGSCGATGTSTANPVRKVILRPVGTKAFNLPNGSRVDLSADLETVLQTAVATYSTFSPTDPGTGTGDDICGTHIEVRAAVSTLQLSVFNAGVNFGYTPAGETSTGNGITAKADVTIGTIAMDFSVWECTAGSCSAIAAATSSALTTGASLSVTLDFGTTHTAPDLIYNSPLGTIIRNIMNDGMKQLSGSTRLNELSWTARVREYLPATGTVVFDAGSQMRLQPNQAFVIYAVTPATGVCSVFKAVANVHTTQVDAISSTAIVDQTLDSRGIQDGDLVMVKAVGTLK